MTTSPFDSFRPPESGRRRRRASGVRGAVSGAAKDVAKGARRGWMNREGGGQREAPAVPDAEFSSYYGQPVVKPVPWDHRISAYLFVGGIAGTSGIIAAGAAATGNEVLRRNSRLTSMVTVGLSGAALVADLGRPERFLNMMRTVKLTSPMSVGTWILSGYSAFAGVTTASEVLGMLPARGPLRPLSRALAPVTAPATIGQALMGAPLAAYTAVLLADTAHPVWHESRKQLPFVFVGSAALASGGMQMLLTPLAHAGPARRLALLGVATELVAMHQLEEHLAQLRIDEPIVSGKGAGKLRLAKVLAIAGGVGTLLSGRNRLAALTSGAALATASALTRAGIVEAGIESAEDPKYTVRVQKDRLEARRSNGVVDDSIVTVQ
ncbi:NrfD/PsrC family molybdoenzyme membrane anchor subunit [Janibacter cremeus]|uniref:Formate-dependent nitrite reductase membrane component NrfD n=1 Tax=Janibacter cremeus TaxID=1285192 RepID=A0A852VY34_9MICO|nr:formate-dependent nitrite reductase membrane component NrfD [Janibacter cremeus]